MADQIALRGLRVRGYHGVLPEERKLGQIFVIDVVLDVDTRPAANSDDLTKTVDYAVLAQQVTDVVAGEPVDLIETLAQRLADVCLASDLIEAVEVVVHKPDAPVPLPFEDVTVTIRRTRS
jgi:dihydroneopterin aldolase